MIVMTKNAITTVKIMKKIALGMAMSILRTMCFWGLDPHTSFLCARCIPICPIPSMIEPKIIRLFPPYIPRSKNAATGSVAPATGIPRIPV